MQPYRTGDAAAVQPADVQRRVSVLLERCDRYSARQQRCRRRRGMGHEPHGGAHCWHRTRVSLVIQRFIRRHTSQRRDAKLGVSKRRWRSGTTVIQRYGVRRDSGTRCDVADDADVLQQLH
jgi:hypothetical protein